MLGLLYVRVYLLGYSKRPWFLAFGAQPRRLTWSRSALSLCPRRLGRPCRTLFPGATSAEETCLELQDTPDSAYSKTVDLCPTPRDQDFRSSSAYVPR